MDSRKFTPALYNNLISNSYASDILTKMHNNIIHFNSRYDKTFGAINQIMNRNNEAMSAVYKALPSALGISDTMVNNVTSVFMELDQRLVMLNENIRTILPAFTEAINSFSSSDTFRQVAECSKGLDAAMVSATSFLQSFNLQMASVNVNVPELVKVFDDISHTTRNIDTDGTLIQLASDGTIVADGRVYTHYDIEHYIGLVISELDSVKLTLTDGFGSLIDAIKHTKDSTVRKIIWHILIPILVTCLVIYIQHISKLYLSGKTDHTKMIRILKSTTISPKPSQYRFVTTNSLNVRSKARVDSSIMGKIHFGQIVSVIYKRKNWTLIEYSEGDSKIQGWVFTRYLGRFR